MEKIPLPKKISISPSEKKNTASIAIEPCFPGHGTTLGNALRRNLLSILPGAAVVAFKLKGASHEFSTIKGVKEDLVEISLNLKKLRLKVHSGEQVRLELNVKGAKEVTAGDISKNSDVEVVNTDLVIATLTEKTAEFSMEILVSQGRGYVTTETHEKEATESGMVYIDSSFSPVERVGFRVERVRVGQMTNWDRLIFDIETDGTLSPEEALRYASEDLISQFSYILENVGKESDENTADTDEGEVAEEPEEETKDDKKENEKK